MMQHVRRRIESLFPAAHDVSIPFSAVPQTGMVSVTMLTLRFGSVLTLGSITGAAVWPESFSVQLLFTVLVAAVSDRSAITRLWVRRTI
ncbi:hypothetical protein ACIQ7D_10035 [Streptomyces sp. NPDC096310]|uniref:hypothetical protein n=1 Tax=Streptomyces sp. NPDC096310 TaxID=3366082 RepID=UPI0038065AC6